VALLLSATLSACATEPDVPLPTDAVRDAAEAVRIAEKNCPTGSNEWTAQYHWRIWKVTAPHSSVEVWADNGKARNCVQLVVVT
jgi:hypothetical protein